jgi:hypothetical protein
VEIGAGSAAGLTIFLPQQLESWEEVTDMQLMTLFSSDAGAVKDLSASAQQEKKSSSQASSKQHHH